MLIAVAGCKQQVLQDLDEGEANKIVSRLSGAGISAEKSTQPNGRWSIQVDEVQLVSALEFLESYRLTPRGSTSGNPKSKRGMIESREEQMFFYEREVSAAIEETLTTLPGVVQARVHLSISQSDPLLGQRNQPPGGGSVLLLVDRFFETSDEQVAALVSGAAGVPAANIKVLRAGMDDRGAGSRLENGAALPPREQKLLSPSAQRVGVYGEFDPYLIAIFGLGAIIAVGLLAARRRHLRKPSPFALGRLTASGE